MSNFITNSQQRSLKTRVNTLIQHSQEVKFLVGYFYFSGWSELVAALQQRNDLHIKILVGLDVDALLGKPLEVALASKSMSNNELIGRYMLSLGNALNDEALDNGEFFTQVGYFLQLLQEDRLHLRKTLEPNHAKLYFFKIRPESQGLLPNDGKFITGSSNLTRAGFQGQCEFNVEIGDYGTEEAERYFDELWDTAVPLTYTDEQRQQLVQFVRTRTQVADVTPFEAYLLVLKNYLDLLEQKAIKPHVARLLAERGFKSYQYQIDAVNQALTIIEQYNGVIIADVVGLGKSVVASMLVRNLGKRGMVLCPPGLIGGKDGASGWRRYLNDFQLFDWEIRSTGDLETAANYLQEYGDDIEVIVVDEAHRFRNEDTEDYEWLSVICKNRIVILLSATPFNNSPSDIFALLKLFIVPGKSKITLDENLEARFSRYNADFRRISYIARYYRAKGERQERAQKFYQDLFETTEPINIVKVQRRARELAAEIRAVLEPVLIRRNRLDLKRDPVYSQEVIDLSEVADPQELFYYLTPDQSRFYDRVVDEFFGEEGRFTGAIYQPFAYEKSKAIQNEKLDEAGNRAYQQQRNLFEFMRRLVVKRFESSFGAFARTIDSFARIHERVLAFIENSGGKYILDRKLLEKIYEEDAESIEAVLDQFEQMLSEKKNRPKHERIYNVRDFDLADQFVQDIVSDLELMREIQATIGSLNLVKSDPKAESLVLEASRILSATPRAGEPIRKIIIFTEYVDTVRHVRNFLESAFPGKVLAVEGSLTSGTHEQALANFDASVKSDKQKNQYQLLLTSDKLSEGFNLNRAGAIINYDIPWNPTRVIQRVGRINRIGRKVFEELNIYNFFPTERGADIIKSREIATQKMFLIHNTLGEDAKIFAIDETPSPAELFTRINRNIEEEEEEGMLTRVRRLFQELANSYPDLIERIGQLPPRVKTAKASTANQLVVFRRKGLGLFIQTIDDIQTDALTVTSPLFEESLPLIECEFSEPTLNLSERFWPAYEALKAYREVLIVPKSDNSVEIKAQNNLQSALRFYAVELERFLSFIQTLILDMREYRTLSKYTLRRLASVDLRPNSPKELAEFKGELALVRGHLGDDYLDVIRQRLGSTKSEIIIAVENQVISNSTDKEDYDHANRYNI